MIERRAGECVTLDTRAEANESVDKQLRYKQIRECLKEGDATAKEVAVLMKIKRYIPTSERNFTAPRLSEMSQQGEVEPVGKKKCQYTGKMVTVYHLREE